MKKKSKAKKLNKNGMQILSIVIIVVILAVPLIIYLSSAMGANFLDKVFNSNKNNIDKMSAEGTTPQNENKNDNPSHGNPPEESKDSDGNNNTIPPGDGGGGSGGGGGPTKDPYCGNSIVEQGEECDAGPIGSTVCWVDCRYTYYGQNFSVVASGINYTIINGDVYQIEANGSLTFVLHYFDPAFIRNYTFILDTVYRIYPSGLVTTANNFSEDFEDVDVVTDLITNEKWQSYSADPTKTNNSFDYYEEGARMSVNQSIVHGGLNSLKTYAPNDTKSYIDRELMFFREKDNVYFSAWYYIQNVTNLAGPVTILDLEADWMDQSPGLRLMSTSSNILSVEIKWINTTNYLQNSPPTRIPMNQWFHIEGHFYLSSGNDGRIELWNNSTKIMDVTAQTMVLPFAIYNSVEWGVTVNGPLSTGNKTMFIDDFMISDRPL